jgi:hypothetical protein
LSTAANAVDIVSFVWDGSFWRATNLPGGSSGYPSGAISLTDAATITTDASTGSVFYVTIAASRTLANPTNPTDGQKIMYRIKQGGAGSFSLTYGSQFRFSTDLPQPSLTATAGKTDRLAFEYNAADTKWDCIGVSRGY